MSLPLRVGMGQPYELRLTIPASVDFDPTLPTGAIIRVTRPDRSSVDWVGVISAQSSASAVVSRAFASTGEDLPLPGTYRAWIQWTVPGMTPGPRTEVVFFAVIPSDQ